MKKQTPKDLKRAKKDSWKRMVYIRRWYAKELIKSIFNGTLFAFWPKYKAAAERENRKLMKMGVCISGDNINARHAQSLHDHVKRTNDYFCDPAYKYNRFNIHHDL